jgi:hypothetical protein
MINNFFSNLFGTIAQGGILNQVPGNIGFIPIDGNNTTLQIKGSNAEWLGLENRITQKYAYEFCYPLASVVDRMAEADINGNIEILRSSGKGKEDFATSPYASRMNTLFEQPNPSQSWDEFRGQQVVYKKVFGFCPVLVVVPVGFEYDPSEASMLLNLPPWLFSVQVDENSGTFPKALSYTCNILNSTSTFKPEQILILKDGFLQDERESFLLPKSKLVGLDMAVSNLCAGMEADNVMLRKRGPIGFISHDAAATKDSVAGYLPMTNTEKTEIQNDLQQYGLSWAQYQYVVSRTAMKWNSMGYDVKQLGTKETIEQATKAICQRMNYSYVLLENAEATFANQNDAHKSLYQNNIIPGCNKDIDKYAKYFKASENNCNFTVDFTHLPIMQEDAEMNGRAKQYANTGLQIEWLNDVITLNQWRTANGYDTTPDGEIYYSQSALKQQANDLATQQNGTTQQNQGTTA